MTIPRVPWHNDPTTLNKITAAIDAAGCCVVEDAIDADTVQAIRRELVAFDSFGSIGASAFEGHTTRRTGAPLPRSATFRSIAMHPAVMCAGSHVLGPTTGWRFSASEFIQIGPGETAQRLHRDQWKYDMVDFPNEIELNGMWAISDFTATNGATQIIPGSHRDGNAEPLDPDAAEPAEMAAGSVLLYTGRLYHGGGPNSSDAWRLGLSLQHAVLYDSIVSVLFCPLNHILHIDYNINY